MFLAKYFLLKNVPYIQYKYEINKNIVKSLENESLPACSTGRILTSSMLMHLRLTLRLALRLHLVGDVGVHLGNHLIVSVTLRLMSTYSGSAS